MKKILASFILIFSFQANAASTKSERLVDQIMKLTNQIRDLYEIRNFAFYSMNAPAGDDYKPWTPMYQAMIKSKLLALSLYTPSRGGEDFSPDRRDRDFHSLNFDEIDRKMLNIINQRDKLYKTAMTIDGVSTREFDIIHDLFVEILETEKNMAQRERQTIDKAFETYPYPNARIDFTKENDKPQKNLQRLSNLQIQMRINTRHLENHMMYQNEVDYRHSMTFERLTELGPEKTSPPYNSHNNSCKSKF